MKYPKWISLFSLKSCPQFLKLSNLQYNLQCECKFFLCYIRLQRVFQIVFCKASTTYPDQIIRKSTEALYDSNTVLVKWWLAVSKLHDMMLGLWIWTPNLFADSNLADCEEALNSPNAVAYDLPPPEMYNSMERRRDKPLPPPRMTSRTQAPNSQRYMMFCLWPLWFIEFTESLNWQWCYIF